MLGALLGLLGLGVCAKDGVENWNHNFDNRQKAIGNGDKYYFDHKANKVSTKTGNKLKLEFIDGFECYTDSKTGEIVECAKLDFANMENIKNKEAAIKKEEDIYDVIIYVKRPSSGSGLYMQEKIVLKARVKDDLLCCDDWHGINYHSYNPRFHFIYKEKKRKNGFFTEHLLLDPYFGLYLPDRLCFNVSEKENRLGNKFSKTAINRARILQNAYEWHLYGNTITGWKKEKHGFSFYEIEDILKEYKIKYYPGDIEFAKKLMQENRINSFMENFKKYYDSAAVFYSMFDIERKKEIDEFCRAEYADPSDWLCCTHFKEGDILWDTHEKKECIVIESTENQEKMAFSEEYKIKYKDGSDAFRYGENSKRETKFSIGNNDYRILGHTDDWRCWYASDFVAV